MLAQLDDISAHPFKCSHNVIVIVICDVILYLYFTEMFMPYFRITTHTVCGYCTNMKLISRGFQYIQVKNHVTDNKFVTLSLHLKGNAEISLSCASS